MARPIDPLERQIGDRPVLAERPAVGGPLA